MQDLKEIYSLLEKEKNVKELHYSRIDKYGFSRNIVFCVGEYQYRINWWANTISLFVAGAEVTDIKRIYIDTCFPSCKKCIKFELEDYKAIRILLEFYDNQKGLWGTE